jgi:hypothetical protein
MPGKNCGENLWRQNDVISPERYPGLVLGFRNDRGFDF